MPIAQRRFVVLDRDGTIIVESHYLSTPEQVELIPGAVSGMRQFRRMGLGLVLITNQSGLGRGFFNRSGLDAIHGRLLELLRAEGVYLDGIYVCPHKPEDNCECRKPKTGLLEQAAKELSFDAPASFVIGDKACDIELGKRIGATTFLVLTGYGSQVAAESPVFPDHVVAGLSDAAKVIARIIETGNLAHSRNVKR